MRNVVDYTAYFETLPAGRIELALEAEADRMVNARFDPEEVESERTVIISERQGSENSPTFWLYEETRAAAFRVHPYHHQIIGDMADLRTMTRDGLYAHYRRYYVPNNAIAVAVGDFEADDMLARVQALYGGIPVGATPPPVTRAEPPQQGERRVRVEREGSASYLYAAYRAPEATHPDWFKLTLLDSMLAGASAPGGSSVGNRTSRLYKALVETELATSVGGGLYPSIEPYLFNIMVTVRDGRTLDEVQKRWTPSSSASDCRDHADRARQGQEAGQSLFAYGTESIRPGVLAGRRISPAIRGTKTIWNTRRGDLDDARGGRQYLETRSERWVVCAGA